MHQQEYDCIRSEISPHLGSLAPLGPQAETPALRTPGFQFRAQQNRLHRRSWGTNASIHILRMHATARNR
jgi:hypothetical protein